jgi:toxin-antitoxin system PIN domain toxin
MILMDLNVLLYAVDADSVHHERASAWLEKAVNAREEEIGLPWAVILGFLRLTTSNRVFPRPLSVQEALEWIRDLTDQPTVRVLNPGKAHLGILGHLLLAAGTGGNLTTDAHLAALCLEQDVTIVTGDRDFLRFPGLRVELIY